MEHTETTSPSPLKMATVKIDGRSFPMAVAIASDEKKLREALEPYYAEIRNAQIQSETKDGELVVTVIKRSGSKGGLIDALEKAPEVIHPSLVLLWELQACERRGEATTAHLIERHEEIEAALLAGRNSLLRATKTLQLLQAAKAAYSQQAPSGF